MTILGARVERLADGHAGAVLAFELANRAYFARTIPDRGDEYFADFAGRHAALLRYQDEGTDHFHVIVDDAGAVLGRVNIVEIERGRGELGFRIAEPAAGKGLASWAVAEVMRLAAEEYGLTGLTAGTSVDNHGSQAVLRKAGFTETGPAADGIGYEKSLLVFKECQASDLPVLEEWLPRKNHGERFARQDNGTSTFLVAWLGGRPAGTGEVMWGGPKEDEVRAAFPGCPEINGLQVWPGRLQSRGIGRAMITEMERLARERGVQRIGLGVDDTNGRARALYEALGYAGTGFGYLDHYEYTDRAGTRHAVADPCAYLVKPL
ncbi:GNAT family N-acetyltransferase [Longispora albida]|uniref:GNAT family N-acetyltransferase n=1 Tax=Longispora albida TaxID=203523 RepID=UPI001FE0CF3D|nr:GNAT family N-acetyltransferase [Longispora albida]